MGSTMSLNSYTKNKSHRTMNNLNEQQLDFLKHLLTEQLEVGILSKKSELIINQLLDKIAEAYDNQ